MITTSSKYIKEFLIKRLVLLGAERLNLISFQLLAYSEPHSGLSLYKSSIPTYLNRIKREEKSCVTVLICIMLPVVATAVAADERKKRQRRPISV